MADLHYKDNVYGNQAAIHGFGQTMRNAMIGAEALRLRQQQEAQQAAFQQQQIALHQQQLNAQMPLWQAQQQHAAAQAQQLAQQRMAGQDLGFNLQQMQQARSGPMGAQDSDIQNALMSRIMQQQGIIAANHSANIGQQVPDILQGANPRMQALMATKTKVLQPVQPGGSLYDASSGQSVFTAPGGPANLTFDQKLELARRAALARMYAEQASGMSRQLSPGATPPNQSKISDFIQGSIQDSYGQGQGGGQPMTQFAVRKDDKGNVVDRIKVQSMDGGKTWNPATAPSIDVQSRTQPMPQTDSNAIQAPSLQYNQ